MATDNTADFIMLYPGVFSAHEKDLAEQYLAENRAINERGPIDSRALAAGRLSGVPGVGPVLPVTEAMVRYNNEKYDPENRLLNDAAYARKLGYPDIMAIPTYGAHDDTFTAPYPPAARDTLLVSQLNHSVTCHRPIHPGDTLHLVSNRRTVTDLTPPEGALHRHLAIVTEGSVYNQRGEKVNDVVFSVMESIKVHQEGKRPASTSFATMWEAPDWTTRPAHYYTDNDWDYIRGLWAAEKRQGSEPLYWEDIRLGDEPTWTVDGPILESLIPSTPYGLGIGGSRTLKREMLDPEVFRTMIRDTKTGIYRFEERSRYIPSVPDGATAGFLAPPDEAGAINTADIHRTRETRSPLINFLGRELAIRHLNNWMGDYGWLQNIRWGIMPAAGHKALGKSVPASPVAQNYLARVPYLAGRTVMAHGLTEDLAIVKSYIYDKYYRDGQPLVDLAWWIETIEGDIWLAGGATVRLPSRRNPASLAGG